MTYPVEWSEKMAEMRFELEENRHVLGQVVVEDLNFAIAEVTSSQTE